VLDAARGLLTDKTAAVDTAVAHIDVRSKFEEWWGILQEPIELTDGVWLVLDPQAVRRGQIHGEGDVVEVPVHLTARPRVVLGRRPPPSHVPLPALDSGAVSPGLQILVEGRAEYGAASRLLTQELRGQVLRRGERAVRIRAIELSGIGGGRLALAVDVDGDARGRLFLVGTPRFDPSTGQVAVPDLDFDVATNDLIVHGASWLARVGLAGYLRERARWPASPAVEWAGDRLREGLNRALSDDVSLKGSVGTVRIVDVYATREALMVRAAAAAEATLVVTDGAETADADGAASGGQD
jgi:hypothetical protein